MSIKLYATEIYSKELDSFFDYVEVYQFHTNMNFSNIQKYFSERFSFHNNIFSLWGKSTTIQINNIKGSAMLLEKLEDLYSTNYEEIDKILHKLEKDDNDDPNLFLNCCTEVYEVLELLNKILKLETVLKFSYVYLASIDCSGNDIKTFGILLYYYYSLLMITKIKIEKINLSNYKLLC
ncbi:hypothetical protein [Carp edema virus]|nr:hypothetical protein [Carp edema virus]